MSLASYKPSPVPFVEATLNYTAPTPQRPRTYTYDPPAGTPRSTVVAEPHKVVIHDARALPPASLDQEGYALLRYPTAVRDFGSEDEIRAVYYPESERALKEVTGADHVYIFDHTVRRRIPGSEDSRSGPRQPVTRVHVDHTAKSGPQRVRDLLPDDAEELLRGRVQVINLWRPIRGPLLDSPLAVCDAATTPFEDFVPSDLVYPDRVGETYQVRYRPQHAWYYYPRMERDEALLLKCYDSETDGRARFVAHSAFVDPTTPQDAPPRESIELRTLVFHRA